MNGSDSLRDGEIRRSTTEACVLVAEDSRQQAERLRDELTAHGYTVTIVANLAEALAKARRDRPDVVVSDVTMPHLDGYALCRAIKSDAALADTPVILTTSLSSPEDVVRGLECGADNFIRKPYELPYLLARLAAIVTNRRLRRGESAGSESVEIELGGRRHVITSARRQIVDLLVSTYEQAVHVNEQLQAKQLEVQRSYLIVAGLYYLALDLNRAVGEAEVLETVLDRLVQLPGIEAAWVFMREGTAGFRAAAARGLPPALETPDALAGPCRCQQRLLRGELNGTVHLTDCERMECARGDTGGLRHHASVPLRVGAEPIGILNVASRHASLTPEEGMLLDGVAGQASAALTRAHLEDHLKTSNAQLEASNRELEAFSYSVSHDLRSPVRAVSMFGEFLADEYGAQLDAQGREYLERVRAAARQMGHLIDGLLNLARLTRADVHRGPVDLAALARVVIADLERQAATRRVTFVIPKHLPATGDAALLQIALANLLSNAWKYTSKEPGARIELGRLERDDGHVFYVRDNGVGFDMTYAHKLFGAFQRLHSASEYEGTGIGLATVERIVTRHGGRVWAESAPGAGATFLFTLPDD